jgi:nitric oxide reductase NorE protein
MPAANASPETPYPLPGDLAIWVFIFAELVVFGILFIAYAVARSTHIALFDTAQHAINRVFGFINTWVLLTSSYFVVRATQAIRRDQQRICTYWLMAAMSLGALFLILKLIEFHQDAARGITLSSNLFDMFYLSLTFFHFMHVVMGMIILSVVTYKAYKGRYSAANHTGVETGASYWHMVDLVWIVLFALVYVMH